MAIKETSRGSPKLVVNMLTGTMKGVHGRKAKVTLLLVVRLIHL